MLLLDVSVTVCACVWNSVLYLCYTQARIVFEEHPSYVAEWTDLQIYRQGSRVWWDAFVPVDWNASHPERGPSQSHSPDAITEFGAYQFMRTVSWLDEPHSSPRTECSFYSVKLCMEENIRPFYIIDLKLVNGFLIHPEVK